MLGARLRAEGRRRGVVELLAQGGRSAEVGGGAWVDGSLSAQAGARAARLHLSGRAELFGLRYSDPFGYAAYGATLQPQIAWLPGRWAVVARGELTRGGWRTDEREAPAPLPLPLPLPLPVALPEPVAGGLSVTGGALDVIYSAGRAAAQLGVEAYRSDAGGAFDGGYGGVGASVSYATQRIAALLGARAWRTPEGSEFGYHAVATVGVRPDVQLRIHFGRTVRDPLYGAGGGIIASVGLGWRIASRTPAPALRIVEVGERVPGGRRVRFRIRAPDARSVAVAGDFTGWDPRPMRREDEATWFLEAVLEPGLHHFGFLLDGSRWTVPEGAPGVADDGWGQKNASVVVER